MKMACFIRKIDSKRKHKKIEQASIGEMSINRLLFHFSLHDSKAIQNRVVRTTIEAEIGLIVFFYFFISIPEDLCFIFFIYFFDGNTGYFIQPEIF